jgi:hypothetical protein
MRIGLLGSSIFYGLVLAIVLILVFTIVNRAQYTNALRDRRFWNKRRFATDTKPISGNLCLDLSSEKGISLTDMSGNGVMPSMDISSSSMASALDSNLSSLAASFNTMM